jgi:16S rRNA (guanine966-N2)-methyltransferase
MKPRRPPGAEPGAPGRVRIIAGRLRGSRIDVPDGAGLRPTSDRVRETLFNWLAPQLPGARCLDLFAGSGALGFEAASRGAATVEMIEREPRVAAGLAATAQRLHADNVRVHVADAFDWLLRHDAARFDVAFVDPPFAAGLLERSLAALDPHLADDARIYVECPRAAPPQVPPGWETMREGTTREVRFALYRRDGRPGDATPPATLAPDSAARDRSETR